MALGLWSFVIPKRELMALQGEGDDGGAFANLLFQLGFELGWGQVKFACFDGFEGGIYEAKFADAVGAFVAFFVDLHRWAIGSARHRAMGIEVAGAGGGIEDGAAGFVCEFFEEFERGFVFAQDAGGWITWEVECQLGNGLRDAAADAFL